MPCNQPDQFDDITTPSWDVVTTVDVTVTVVDPAPSAPLTYRDMLSRLFLTSEADRAALLPNNYVYQRVWYTSER